MKDRIRISLTLRPEIVSLLDSKVDGTKIRNRSHAVEQFLKQALLSPAGQAVLLIGNEDKALTNICGETPLEKILTRLHKAGVHSVILCCKSENKLRAFLKKKKFANFNFTYVKNPNKGTAAALLQCKKHLKPETFLLIYGDIIAELDIYDFVDFHTSHSGAATMLITTIADPFSWGMVKVKRNRIIDFFEKPNPNLEEHKRLTNIINAGIYAFQPAIFEYMNKNSKSLETDVIPKLIQNNQLFSYLLDGAWFNVSREDLLSHARKYCTPKKSKKKV